MEPTTQKIKLYFNSLTNIQKVLEGVSKDGRNVDGELVTEYERVLEKAKVDLPQVLPDFNSDEFFSHRAETGDTYYKSSGLKANIGINIGILKSKLDDFSETPVIQTKSFDFISNNELKLILERDYLEIQRNISSSNWKSAIILSGGSIEAILLELLLRDSSKAKGSSKAPKENDLNKWDLNSLLEVALEEKLIDDGIAKLGHTVREYRNLIHPGVEIRKRLKVEPEEAKIAIEVLNILIRDLGQ